MDSGNSSPHCRDIDGDNNVSPEETPAQQSPSRVKLMCSYGGRIQPRPHDNQLVYFGGETKILAVDRSIRFPAIIAKLAALHGSADLIRVKYQLPGEDLDSLISVTNDEDLEQMMIEYDRLFLCSGKPSARLRLFLFTANRSIGSGTDQDKKKGKDPQQFVSGMDRNPLLSPPTPASTLVPDLLSGNAPSPASFCSTDLEPENLAADNTLSAKTDQGKEENPQQIAGATEILQRRILELQIPGNQYYPPASMHEHGIEEPLSRVYHREYYPPGVHDHASSPALTRFPIPTSTAQIPAGYWSDQFPLRQFPMYLIPASLGIHSSTPRHAYYQNPFPRIPPANFPAVYGVAPPPPQTASMVSPTAPPPLGMDDVTVRPVFYPAGVNNTEPATTKPT